MKKIMFNDKYGLTAAVLEGRKTMTRRIIKAPRRTIEGKEVCGFAIHKTSDGVPYEVWLTGPDEESLCQLLPTYKVCEIVAVAQNYHDVYEELKRTHGSSSRVTREFFHKYVQGGRMPVSNKMFVKPDLMPHNICITGIKIERIQDISEEDCLKEGVYYDADVDGYKVMNLTLPNKWGHKFRQTYFQTPREAFAHLIDKVSGKGTFESNPWVFAYTFELID